ncbi:hypothetical protein L207DRAFT_573440 [Hyaloscypha variabilis F]|uniref:Uncharacterized protein n=1 Tax=Hyaloscypha variabilis (strain UAMH 11265 / GT02V1 / F) TaxID=1149755 RepID=A0A2J6QWG5_HYAVF|nr:hypothetical protein L207DRAFT_573440 [Hyaloscypha variabilis F]
MPPKKAKPTKKQLKEKVDEYNIKFEGPVPPRLWPSPYSYLFHVIRDIWANRYDDYIKRTDISQKAIRGHRARVRDLRTNAYRLRTDFGINEETWRASIEALVFRRFDQEIVCVYCRNENWESDSRAKPFDEDEKEELERKRSNRRQCTCDDGTNAGRNLNEDSDEEHQTKIFCTSIGMVVSHDPQDDLENSGVPMKADRVIGLSMNNRYQGYIRSFPVELSHSPVINRRLLMYPFLVLEAKRENDAPGFRYVETQTAFPIRRFLRIQDELQSASGIKFFPLVWFFAFQGEGWRLHAAILDDEKMVQVFELWDGNLESQDGALQICQIVDFIWTWARDVYRPQIRKCLRRQAADQREISPTSTNPYRRSESVLSMPSARSFSQPLLDALLEEDTIVQEVVSDDQPAFRDASSDPFLKWADRRDVSTTWTPNNTSMRHSDIVMFSFRVLEIPEDQESFYDLIHSLRYDDENSRMMLHVLRVIRQNQYTLPMKRGQIHDLEKFWTGIGTQTSYGRSIMSRPDESIRAFILFRTFCQQEDWQLKREVYCVIWSEQAASLLSLFLGGDINFIFNEDSPPLIQQSMLNRAFQQLRNLSGRHSVAYALDNTSLVLLPSNDASGRGNHLQWRQPQSKDIPKNIIEKSVAWFDFASSSEDVAQSYHHRGAGLLWVIGAEQTTSPPPELMNISEEVGKGGAMLAMKSVKPGPGSWPQQCPRFCLFVLLSHGFQEQARLRQLLQHAVQMRDLYCVFQDYGEEQEALSVADMRLLKEWENALCWENM